MPILLFKPQNLSETAWCCFGSPSFRTLKSVILIFKYPFDCITLFRVFQVGALSVLAQEVTLFGSCFGWLAGWLVGLLARWLDVVVIDIALLFYLLVGHLYILFYEASSHMFIHFSRLFFSLSFVYILDTVLFRYMFFLPMS